MIVGIDLGTSTSEVSIVRSGKPVLIREVRHSTSGILPSVVGIDRRGTVCVGSVAASLLIPKPEFAIEEVKRLMGSDATVTIGGEAYRPQEISAFLLRHLRDEAERFLGQPVTEAIITVPAFWTDAARQATQDAGELAGLKVRRLINEPTAAALAYGIERPGVEEKILVYDLGGGTLDVTVLELSEGILDVLASVGNPHLGGKDLDERLMRYLAEQCRAQVGIDPTIESRHRSRLRDAARRAKEALSSVDATMVLLDNLGVDAQGSPLDFEHELTRHSFEALVRDLIESTRHQLDAALAEKGVSRDEIATILMIGGSTRIPFVRRFVSDYFGGRSLRTDISPDEAVSLGAAVLGALEQGTLGESGVIITDVAPFTLGVATTVDREGNLVSGIFDALIERQSTIPRTVRRTYNTLHDWQAVVHVRVYQGEEEFCDDNTAVGDFHHEITPAPAGAPVEVSMSYNLNGIVEIVARDPANGRETKFEVTPSAVRMSEDEKKEASARLERRWAQHGTSASASNLSEAPRPRVAGTPPQAATSSSTSSPAHDDWRSHPLFAPLAPLVTHAERQLPALAERDRARVRVLLLALRDAVLSGKADNVQAAEHQLTDALFDME